jgi:hypothetical protein
MFFSAIDGILSRRCFHRSVLCLSSSAIFYLRAYCSCNTFAYKACFFSSSFYIPLISESNSLFILISTLVLPALYFSENSFSCVSFNSRNILSFFIASTFASIFSIPLFTKRSSKNLYRSF